MTPALKVRGLDVNHEVFSNMGQATPKAANALQQRITALDRSKDRFSLQLAEAYNLLDLDLETISIYYSHVDAEKVARRGFDPKEEWVLRWLLKRFGEEVVGKGRSESPTANTSCIILRSSELTRETVPV